MKNYFPVLFAAIGLAACNGAQPNQSPAKDSALYSDIIWPVTDSIRQFPDQHALYYRRALLLFNTNPALAQADFEKAAQLDPANPEYWAGAGEAALVENKYPAAAASFSKALANAPGYTYLQYRLATALIENRQYGEADSLANVLAQTKDARDKAFYLKARMAEDKNDTAAAITHLTAAVKAAGDHPEFEAVMELGDLLRARKAPAAIEYYTLAWQLDTLNAAPLYDAAQLHEVLGHTDQAIATYRRCIVLDPGYSPACMALGKIYSDRKDWNNALVYYKLAVKSAPTDAWAYYQRARCEEQLGMKAAALEDYAKAASFRKDFKEAREAMERLHH
ncbi:tetratricopeptide repeat protein [Chitinophaga sp. Mgbs1]|uniref:Tetratricopeptide repeat protein n=1 Tax=Chitinophaga solisilvae TaxID=1233460 RepID=A0A3S1B1Z8_9BACT|nr:tetratricopeptide repeat protein [Chitinophaga solisilvae]